MKRTLLLISCLLFTAPTACTSMGSSGSKTAEDNKQQVNFYGILTTHQGQTDTVDHILIEGKHNDIIMYDAPVNHAAEKFNNATKQTEIKLEANPITDFSKTRIDLSTISTIKVPNELTIWFYQKEKKHQRIEFLLVEITAKESSESKPYLLEHRTNISCNSVGKSGSQKKEVPLSAIDTLTIEGYSFALSTEKKDTKKTGSATCPLVKTETETTTEIVVK